MGCDPIGNQKCISDREYNDTVFNVKGRSLTLEYKALNLASAELAAVLT